MPPSSNFVKSFAYRMRYDSHLPSIMYARLWLRTAPLTFTAGILNFMRTAGHRKIPPTSPHRQQPMEGYWKDLTRRLACYVTLCYVKPPLWVFLLPCSCKYVIEGYKGPAAWRCSDAWLDRWIRELVIGIPRASPTEAATWFSPPLPGVMSFYFWGQSIKCV